MQFGWDGKRLYFLEDILLFNMGFGLIVLMDSSKFTVK